MSETIAVIAGKEIKEADFEAFLKGAPKEQQPYLSNPQFREQFKEQFLALHMFAQLGEDEKMNETEEFKTMVDNATRDILAQLAVNSVLKNVTVTPEAKPFRALSIRTGAVEARSSADTLAIEAVTTLFFWTP